MSFAAVAAAALMAVGGASSASATVLCKTTSCGSLATSLEWSLTGTAKLESGGITLDTCTGGTMSGSIEEQGATVTARGKVAREHLTWTGCTNTTDTLKGGELEVHAISNTDNGTVTATGFEVTIATGIGSCVYGFGTEHKDLGTLEGGTEPKLVIDKEIPLISGPCSSTAVWNATYLVTNPKPLFVTSAPPTAVLCSEGITEGCGAAGKDYAAGTPIELSSTSSGKLVAGGITLDECTGSTIKGKTANTGGTEPVRITNEEISWGTCTHKTTTTALGELELQWIAGTDNGTSKSNGTQVTVATIFGSCTYSAPDLGTLVGGAEPTIEVKELSVKLVSGPCPTETKWTQSFAVTSPKPLFVSKS
ncbi:MAG: hypothetical protein ACTHNP_09970 [Solirubrobacterales bacterium]